MPNNSEVAWIKQAEDYQLSFVPGVDLGTCETKYSKNKDNPAFIKKFTNKLEQFEKTSEKVKKKSVSLKDLCVEDKKRIGNLIQELASLQEEKDEIDEKLEEERRMFQTQLKALEIDKKEICKEKDEIKGKYVECQKMLHEYQESIIQKQKETAEEIKQLNESVKQYASRTPLSISPHQSKPSVLQAKQNNGVSAEGYCKENISPQVDSPSLKFSKQTVENEENEIETYIKLGNCLNRLGLAEDISNVFKAKQFKESQMAQGLDECDASLLKQNIYPEEYKRNFKHIEIKNKKLSEQEQTLNRVVQNTSNKRKQLAVQKAALEREQFELRKLLLEQDELLLRREQQDLQLYNVGQNRAARKQLYSNSNSGSSIQTRLRQGTGLSKSLNFNSQKQNQVTKVIGSPKIQSTMMHNSDPFYQQHFKSSSHHNIPFAFNDSESVVSGRSWKSSNVMTDSIAENHSIKSHISSKRNRSSSICSSRATTESRKSTSRSKFKNTPKCNLPNAYYTNLDCTSTSSVKSNVVDVTDIIDEIEEEFQTQENNLYSPIHPLKSVAPINSSSILSPILDNENDDSELLEDIFFIK